MAKSNRILALDIGATGIKAAEFEMGDESLPVLQNFAIAEYGDELTEDTRQFLVRDTLGRILKENSFAAKTAYLSISGQFTLTRFVKLPPVAEEESRVRQIVEFEARQNVPFPMEEVMWDYQLISNPDAEELEVMFVVIKNEIVDEITRAVQECGVFPMVVDIAPAACYNAARANGIGEDECALVLDVGGKSTNLLFMEKGRFFTRTIPIAGATITQQIAKELNVTLEEAENIKLRHGFVGLGGAYEDPASEVAATVSKIVRNVMNRLHGEVNRSIGVYRSQQKGNRPTKLFLTGGSSVLGYMTNFFSEKLGVPAQYLNPFQIVRLSPSVDTERLENNAHIFSPLVGLALRRRAACPVEVNLIPENITRQIALKRKKPYLIGCVVCFVLTLVVVLFTVDYKRKMFDRRLVGLKEQKEVLENKQNKLVKQQHALAAAMSEYEQVVDLIERKENWVDLMREIERLRPDYLWLVEIKPITDAEDDPTVRGRKGGRTMRDEMMMPAPMPFDPTMRRDPTRGGEPEQEKIEIKDDPGPTGRIVALQLRGHSLSLPAAATAAAATTATTTTMDDESKTMATGGDEGGMIDPEQVFLERLRKSSLFEKNSVFDDYTTSGSVLNLRGFTVRLNLIDPMELEYKKIKVEK